MRQVSGMQQFEAYMVLIMVSAINTADDWCWCAEWSC